MMSQRISVGRISNWGDFPALLSTIESKIVGAIQAPNMYQPCKSSLQNKIFNSVNLILGEFEVLVKQTQRPALPALSVHNATNLGIGIMFRIVCTVRGRQG